MAFKKKNTTILEILKSTKKTAQKCRKTSKNLKITTSILE